MERLARLLGEVRGRYELERGREQYMASLSESNKDRRSALHITGRYQEVRANAAKMYKRSTLAAGAVLWRRSKTSETGIEVAVIHRPHYDDWSLAKGKVDPGESLVVTAAREISEETGYEVSMGKLLGHVTYPVGDRTKVVYYWTAEVNGGEFTANKEVDELRWLNPGAAGDLLTYEVDQQILHKATRRLTEGCDARIILVRHGRAHQRANWNGNDYLRPLDKKGRRQADYLSPLLAAYHPDRLYSAQPDRCQQTGAPTAEALGLELKVKKAFGDHGWEEDAKGAKKALQKVLERGGTSVVFSQGIFIPEAVECFIQSSEHGADGLGIEEVKAKKGSAWVLSFRNGALTGADYIESPLPVK